MSTWLLTEVDILTNSLRAVIAEWLNDSQRSRNGVGMVRYVRGEVLIALNSPKVWIPRYIRTYLLLILQLQVCSDINNFVSRNVKHK